MTAYRYHVYVNLGLCFVEETAMLNPVIIIIWEAWFTLIICVSHIKGITKQKLCFEHRNLLFKLLFVAIITTRMFKIAIDNQQQSIPNTSEVQFLSEVNGWSCTPLVSYLTYSDHQQRQLAYSKYGRNKRRGGYFKLGKLLNWVPADERLRNLKYVLFICSRHTWNRLMEISIIVYGTNLGRLPSGSLYCRSKYPIKIMPKAQSLLHFIDCCNRQISVISANSASVSECLIELVNWATLNSWYCFMTVHLLCSAFVLLKMLW